MVRTYRDTKAKSYVSVLLLLVVLAFVTLGLTIGVASFIAAVSGGSLWLIPFSLVWLLGTGWGTYELLSQCGEIRLSDEGLCEFRSPLRRTRVFAYQVTSVELPVEDGDCARVCYRGGTIDVGLMHCGFRDFLAQLKEFNPDVEVVGS